MRNGFLISLKMLEREMAWFDQRIYLLMITVTVVLVLVVVDVGAVVRGFL